MIEHVEYFPTELHVLLLARTNAFQQGYIGSEIAGTDQRSRSGVTKRSGSGYGECRRVPPSCQRTRVLYRRITDEVRTVVTRTSAAADVLSESRGPGSSGIYPDDAGHFPSASQRLDQA